jgi:hypothetical protein
MRNTSTLPLLLALSLAAACGDEGTTTTPPAPPRDATPPVLEILAPASDSVLVAGPMLVRGRCSEDDVRGCTVKVLLRDTLIAEGPDSVNAVVSLEKHLGQAVRFVFVATNKGGGSTRAETGEFRVIEPDAQPRLEIIGPAVGTTRMLTTRVRLQARCTAPPECVSITAFVGQTEVARGTSSVLDTVVSLAAVGRDTVRFRFEAVNRHGTRTTAQTVRFDLQTSPYWSEVLAVPLFLVDVDQDRVLYTMTAPSGLQQLRLLDRRTGADSLLADNEKWFELPGARLIPSGHVMVDRATGELREYGGSNARAPGGHGFESAGFQVTIRGRWLTWIDPGGIIHRDDVLAPRLTRTPQPRLFSPGQSGEDIGADGSVAYLALPEGSPEDGSVARQLFLLRPSGVAEQVTSDPGVMPLRPQTDGTNSVYAKHFHTRDGDRYRLMLHTPAGEEALTEDVVVQPWDYDAEAGWVVFTLHHPYGAPTQVWARSPSGEVRQITQGATSSTLLAVGPDGQVLLHRGGRGYLARTPFSPLVDVGRGFAPGSALTIRWLDGKLHVFFGSTLYRIEP